ncbi:MAG: type III-B CRISPR module-associated protein Cmr5 [Candidatus Promineifilaceae bacterium]
MQTLSQKYAADAYKRVNQIAEKDEKYQKKYGTMAHKLPILIRTAGLVQALAFVAAKGSGTKAWWQYLEDVAKTVDAQLDAKMLIEKSQKAKAGLNEYILLTRRVSQATLWYKRFAESILKVEASEQTDDETEEEEGDA